MLDTRPLHTTEHRFIPGLESLRGLAALMVCLFHTGQIKVGNSGLVSTRSWLGVLFNGHGAVVLFFVLSGFVLRLSLATQWQQETPRVVSGYLVARFFRLFPVIVLTVLVMALVKWFWDNQSVSPVELGRNAALLSISLNGAFWTLQVEVFGSLLILIAFLIERRTNFLVLTVLTVALIPLSFRGSHFTIDAIVLPLLYPFMFGYLIAAQPTSMRDGPAGSATVLLLVALTGFFYSWSQGYVFKGWLLLLTTMSAALIVELVASRQSTGPLDWRLVRVLGLLSYSFYALHLLGVKLADRTAQALSVRATPMWIIAVIAFAVAVSASVLLAVCMHLLIERPGNVFGRRLRNIITRRNGAAVASSDLSKAAALSGVPVD